MTSDVLGELLRGDEEPFLLVDFKSLEQIKSIIKEI